jgi:hypothetical protein
LDPVVGNPHDRAVQSTMSPGPDNGLTQRREIDHGTVHSASCLPR